MARPDSFENGTSRLHDSCIETLFPAKIIKKKERKKNNVIAFAGGLFSKPFTSKHSHRTER